MESKPEMTMTRRSKTLLVIQQAQQEKGDFEYTGIKIIVN